MKKATKLTCFDVAEYFLYYSYASEDNGETVSNLRLQKLCYYAQAYYLAFYGETLFNDEIKAMQHGPVIPNLYRKYKVFGKDSIHFDLKDFNKSKYSDEQEKLLFDIFLLFGQFTAWKLRNMTHDDEPWIVSYNSFTDKTISPDSLKEYFSVQKEKLKEYFSEDVYR